jgi:hypothetical protein
VTDACIRAAQGGDQRQRGAIPDPAWLQARSLYLLHSLMHWQVFDRIFGESADSQSAAA